MTNTDSDYIPHLDWEGLYKPKTFEAPFDGPAIIPGATKIVVSRDEDYNITGTVYGYTPEKCFPPKCDDKSLYQEHDVSVQHIYGTINISQLRVQGIRWTPVVSPEFDAGSDFVATFTAQTVSFASTANPNEPRYSFREWYINAPIRNDFFHQRVNRKKTVIYEHERGDSALISDRFELMQSGQCGVGCIIVDVGDFRFLIECVPDVFDPAWSKKLMIEYRDEWGYVPDETTRRYIADLLSFLFGRQLIPIGAKSLDRKGYVIDETYASHLQPNIRHLAKQHSRYTVAFVNQPAAFEKALVTAVQACQKRTESLPIAECLRRYWLAVELPMGLNIVILASTLEFLAKEWFKSPESKSQGAYMTHEAYTQLIQPEITALEQKLGTVKGGTAISKRIRSAYNLGSNDHTEMFFNELGISLNKQEREILRGRNKYVHGGNIDITEASATWSGYEFLFTRVMQRILELPDCSTLQETVWMAQR